ncbi:DUF4350 domain-containing protein [Actinopolymorpha sp. B9G3]|uniref:DUF4350 domain-containing protein n=1 Tax=Actinopolymorpha sp. B9G3 TaxID=3158970 RepID=UPI0032D96B5A
MSPTVYGSASSAGDGSASSTGDRTPSPSTEHTASAPADPARSRSIDPTRGDVWRRLRGPLAIAAVLVIVGGLIAVLQGRSTGGPLDPESARRSGARALAVLLADQGVEVRRVRTLDAALASAAGDTTVLVTQSDLLVPSQLRRLARAETRHFVLAEPGEEVLSALAPKALTAGSAIPRTREPGCDLPAARRAGSVRVDGPMYRAPEAEGATTCYGDVTRGAIVRLTGVRPRGERTVDIVGTSVSFTNGQLGEEGNAALALNLLGRHRTLVWYIPSLSDVPLADRPEAGAPPDVLRMLPTELQFGVAQVAVGVALLMVAYARRLGPVVAEPLPVVVRASEAVEGRARLYHRARARDVAAAALRGASRNRLAARLGLSPGTAPDVVAAAVAARTGQPPTQVASLLAGPGGPEPHDDPSLVRLADALDTLEQEVRRS